MMNYMIMVIRMKNNFKYYLKSGSSSCDAILNHLHLNREDEVIVPVTLCKSIIDVIIKNKLKPVFVDINDNFLMYKEEIERKITNKTKAIIFVEQYGNNIYDGDNYYNKNNERIIKILDSCQNGIKKTNDTFDYVFYSFNKRKPIDLNGYALLISKHKLNVKNVIPFKIIFKLFINKLIYRFRLLKKKHILNIIKNNIKIQGRLLECDNYSYHRIIYVMDINKKKFNIFEDKLYKYMESNNLDIVQTTIDEAPYEELKVKDKFDKYNELRYKTLYFRSDNKIKNYYKIIDYINEIGGDFHE